MRSRRIFSRRFLAVLWLAVFPFLRAFRRASRAMGFGVDARRPLAEVIPLQPYLSRTRVVRKGRSQHFGALRQ